MIKEHHLRNEISIIRNWDLLDDSLLKIKTSSDGFVLKGVEAFDNICNNETPSEINLSGNCGAGTVRLVSDNRNKGTFIPNVKCG